MSGNYIEKTDGFEFKQNENLITCTREFVDNPPGSSDKILGTDTLPKIGDTLQPHQTCVDLFKLKQEYTTIFCRKYTQTYLGGDARVGHYIFEYSSEPCDASQFTDLQNTANDLPQEYEVGGNFIGLNPSTTEVDGKTASWQWSSDSQPIEKGLPIPFLVGTATISLEKVVKDGAINSFREESLKIIGKINTSSDNDLDDTGTGSSTSLFTGFPGCWLYLGHTEEPFDDGSDNRWWRLKLNFAFRNPIGNKKIDTDPKYPNAYGWLKILRNSGIFDIPFYDENAPSELTEERSYLYASAQSTSFNSLFTF